MKTTYIDTQITNDISVEKLNALASEISKLVIASGLKPENVNVDVSQVDDGA